MSRKTGIAVAGSALALVGMMLLILWSSPFQGRQVPDDGPTLVERREVAANLLETGALIQRLQRTNLLNGDEIYDQLGLVGDAPDRGGDGFLTHSPYQPRYRESYQSLATLHYPAPGDARSYEVDVADSTFSFYGQEPVLEWYSSLHANAEVCAVRFVDSSRVDYRLRTFPDRQSALAAGYVVTHHRHCGTCSSLRNLAVYLATPDLISPARTCTRKLTPSAVKACFMKEVGLEERCAEAWTYNVLHTRRHCTATCIAHHGFWSVLTNNMGDAHVDECGNLNPCLACDEHTSGPGFQYTAGRTRRASGVLSTIDRPAAQIFSVDHHLYFR